MAVTLVVEDGSGVVGANTYQDVAGLTTFATNRGVTLPTDQDAIASALIRAMDLIGTYSDSFVGYRSYATQALDWPRSGIYDQATFNPQFCPTPLPPNYMPPKLLEAQSQAALAALTMDLQPNLGTTGFVTSEKVGPIQTDYTLLPGMSLRPTLPAFAAAIETLCEKRSPLTVRRG